MVSLPSALVFSDVILALLVWISLVLALIVLAYRGVPLWLWTLYGGAILGVTHSSLGLWVIFGAIALLLNLPPLRQRGLTAPLVKGLRALKHLPSISETEQAAIEAGTVWVEREFFSGQPNLQRLLSEPYPQATPELQAFLAGPVEQVCRMATDWDIYQHKDLPPAVWQYLRQERFFGMMIPQEYGGLGFSNLAYSAVMTKLASRSFTHVATVGVTNSLGPAKLLLRYGTPAQKDYYLPRLARGEEIPCFALTEPLAGSDAASLTSHGVLFKGADGQLYLRLNWQKRYITLGSIATLIGLAFRLFDPDHLLGEKEDLGITCALVEAKTPGVVQNRRHDPMGVPFYNAPLEGKDVVIPADQIIGGIAQAGQGWKMLMQTLAAGRGISFPATCTGVAKWVARVAGAHAVVRQQFGLSIGRFEGVAEPLARIGGLTYLMDAVRLYTCGAVDRGEQPAVAAAIAKYSTTELARRLINDGMDILGGSGICRGPHNLLANMYTATPISITVEGANILTRTLMIFGQGAIRSHPYLYAELKALQSEDIPAFDALIWHHLGSLVRHTLRTLLLSLTRGALARSPLPGATAVYARKLAWASATFALFSDLALLRLGGRLKRHEALTGRFADLLIWLYLGTATLWRFRAEGQRPEDKPLLDWAMQYTFAQLQQTFEGLFANLSPMLRPWLFLWRLNPIGSLPSDALGAEVATILQTPGAQRDRLTAGIDIPTHPDEALGQLEQAMVLTLQAAPILKALKLPSAPPAHLEQRSAFLEEAVLDGRLTLADKTLVETTWMAQKAAIQVDTFAVDAMPLDPVPEAKVCPLHSATGVPITIV